MPLSFDRKLPVDRPPVWPDICIRCGRDDPDSVFRFRAGRLSWLHILLLTPLFSSRPRVEVPACASCAKTLRGDRITRAVIDWFIIVPVVIAVVAAMHYLGLGQSPFRKWIALAAVIVILLPYLIWEVHHPPIVDATVHGDTIDYEFADPLYAARFAIHNNA